MAKKLKNLKITSVDLVKRGANPDAYIKICKSEKGSVGMKKSFMDRVYYAVAKAMGTLGEEMMEPEEYIEKAAEDMAESLDSIMADDTLTEDERASLIQKSFEEYSEDLKKSARKWKKDEEDPDDIDEFDEEDDLDEEDDEDDNLKYRKPKDVTKKKAAGGCKNMKFNIEKMTDEDKTTFEQLRQKYGIADEGAKKSAEDKKDENLMKSSMAEIEELKKSIELGRLVEVAKKYEPLGKKADELAEQLYQYKKVDEEFCKSYLSALDEALKLQEESGIFKTFGTGRSDDGGPELEKITKSIMESNPGMTYEQASTKAFEDNPELLAEYDKNYMNSYR